MARRCIGTTLNALHYEILISWTNTVYIINDIYTSIISKDALFKHAELVITCVDNTTLTGGHYSS